MDDDRPRFPTALPGATGPLPQGWHRVFWRHTRHPDGPLHMVTSCVVSAVFLVTALKSDRATVPDSVVMESWSDFPPTD